MTEFEQPTALEAEAVTAMFGAAVDEARKRGVDLVGIDYPAIAVRAAITTWVIAARSFKPVLTDV